MSQNEQLLEKAAGAPAHVLDKTINTSKQITQDFVLKKQISQAKD